MAMNNPQNNDFLEFKARKQIYQFISKNPALHKRELSRKLKIPKTTLNYHLIYLEKCELISKKTELCYVRYYIKNRMGSRERELISLFRNENIRHIIVVFFWQVATSKIELSDFLEKHPNTIDYYLKKLLDADIIIPATKGDNVVISPAGTIIERTAVGREIIYTLKDVRFIWDVLIAYQNSYLDETADLILEATKIASPNWGDVTKTGKFDSRIDRMIEEFNKFFPLPFCA